MGSRYKKGLSFSFVPPPDLSLLMVSFTLSRADGGLLPLELLLLAGELLARRLLHVIKILAIAPWAGHVFAFIDETTFFLLKTLNRYNEIQHKYCS